MRDELSETEKMRILAETDIYQETFKNMLKEFCHHYQIPFLENNIPKSCRNAAKIYYRLLQDGKKPNDRFEQVTRYLESIPEQDIDDKFDPNKMKEKWMKFFRSGFTRILVDTDRALKNDLNESLKMFIMD